MILYTPVQQAIRCNLYLYALTIMFQNNREFELFRLLEPIWSRLEGEEGILHYIRKPGGLLK